MTTPLGVGLIGCGNISTTYLKLGSMYRHIALRACADVNHAAAETRAAEFGIQARTVEDLLASGDIDIVVNLTVPAAHYEVSGSILQADKHVYSEKPFVLSVEEGASLAELAGEKGLRIGSAPDTFLGGAHQQARALIDEGAIGTVTGGTAHVLSHGMEHWHPNPDFFFQPGAGPVLDVGPYYIANLIQLIGSVSRVTALSATPSPLRTIGAGAREGERIPVDTPTTIHAVLEFSSGALVTLGASWDVWSHRHSTMELYGEKGTLFLPDPNFFGGVVELSLRDGDAAVQDLAGHPFGKPNEEHPQGGVANYRGAGLADMALAIMENRPHRCSHDLALHTVDVMTSILTSAETGAVVNLQTQCERPHPLDAKEAQALLLG